MAGKSFLPDNNKLYSRPGIHMCCADMSPNTLSSCCSFPWPSTAQTTMVINLSLPIYFPFMSHYHVTLSTQKKESFSGSLPLFLVCPPEYLAQSKNLPSYMPAHSRSFSYLYCTSCSCKERYILERRSPATQITLSTQWFLEQSQCTVQFYFLTVTERAPDAA